MNGRSLSGVGVDAKPAAGLSASPDALADTICAREPVHVPGATQPHGVLLALDPGRGYAIVAASANLPSLLAGQDNRDAGALLGQPAAGLLGDDFVAGLAAHLAAGQLDGSAPWETRLAIAASRMTVEASSHSHDGLVIVELEAWRAEDDPAALATTRLLQRSIAELRGSANDLDALARVTVRAIRQLTGYERVLIYRFGEDWHGQAIAEDKVADWAQSLDGLHFPASDIPEQARALYRRSLTRAVQSRDAAPVPLQVLAEGQPGGAALPQRPIDLSFARLRSLSPVHMQYHRNMGVDASMSLSILHDGELWGLVVCHHRAVHRLSPGQRAAASALTDAFALRIGTAERSGAEALRRGEAGRLAALMAHMAQTEDLGEALTGGAVTMLGLFGATGAAVILGERVTLLGRTPDAVAIGRLAAWLRARPAEEVFHTEQLPTLLAEWTPHAAIASGLLAIALSAERNELLLWFRPEEPFEVSWGGNPNKNAEHAGAPGADPARDVLPRSSFERWVELRHGTAAAWQDWELEIAASLRHAITEVILRNLRRIADLNERLRQSQKMEAVGQLTGGIAHDFNNLLTGITGSLELMRTRVAQGRIDEIDRYLGAAMTSSNRAAALTHRLLAFSRRQTLDPKPTDVNRLCTSIEELIRRTVGPAIHLETVMSGGLWLTLCDANQLENALLNLAINAKDAMPDGGRLTIEAANAWLDEAYAGRHHNVAPGQYVAVSVTDTGIGMSPELVGRVFEPFFTTKPLGQGTGLGLSMVYGFAQQSNGYARIYSEPGHGTTVRLYLPRHLGEVAAADQPAAVISAASVAGETVMVVDDEPVVRMLVVDVLRELGFAVAEAIDGADAVRQLAAGPPLDLLITDVGLPGGMNGRQLAELACEQQPGLKVLFITGYAENAALGHGVLAPGMHVITKPFAMDVLAAKIRAIL